jgi:hypothetical protein
MLNMIVIIIFCLPAVGGLIEQIKLWVLTARDKKQIKENN